MNQKIIIGIVALVLLVGAGYYIFSQGDTSDTQETSEIAEKIDEDTESTVEDAKEESFTGTLLAAIELGVPMKCTYEVGGIEYEGLIKGKQYKGQISMPDGSTGQVIMKENCMYTWTEGVEQGWKTCFTDEDQSMWEQTDTTGNIPGSYKCLPAPITDAAFDLPTDVNFMDLESLKQR